VSKTAGEAVALLGALTADRAHVFFSSLPSPARFARVFDRVLGHRQVTDAYLVGLARHHKASLLTFDTRAEAHGADAIEVLR
jgi:predicted nucleic acid-binding protein